MVCKELIFAIVQFFGEEDIFDVMDTLHKVGVNKKAARIWFKLNQDTDVRVKNCDGMTEKAKVGDCIGQGTGGAALVSHLNLDYGLQENFADSLDELYYGDVRVQAMSYHEDATWPGLASY